MTLLHSETAVANPTNETHPVSRHDILEVNNYFMSGLVVSSIDKWFMGPVPRFFPRDLGVSGAQQALSTALERARNVADDPAQMAWQLVGIFMNGELRDQGLMIGNRL